MFRRVNGEGLAYDQMFCTSDCRVDRHGTVSTSVVKYWCGYRCRISFWMAIVPAHPLSKALSHTRSQHLMFRMCFRDWRLLASVRVRFLSLLKRSSSALWTMDVASSGYLRHLSVILSWVKWLSSHRYCWTRLISSTLATNRHGPKCSWTKCVIIAGMEVSQEIQFPNENLDSHGW